MDAADVRFPAKDDRLFVDAFSHHNGVRTQAVLMKSWDEYQDAFFQSAVALIRVAQDKSHSPRVYVDTICIPAIFLFRQYVELTLKRLVSLLQKRRDPQSFGYRKNHNLQELWQKAEKGLQEAFAKELPDLTGLASCIDELHNIDPRSDELRFPTDKQNNPSLSNHHRIDMQNLLSTMGRVRSLLDGVIGELEKET